MSIDCLWKMKRPLLSPHCHQKGYQPVSFTDGSMGCQLIVAHYLTAGVSYRRKLRAAYKDEEDHNSNSPQHLYGKADSCNLVFGTLEKRHTNLKQLKEDSPLDNILTWWNLGLQHETQIQHQITHQGGDHTANQICGLYSLIWLTEEIQSCHQLDYHWSQEVPLHWHMPWRVTAYMRIVHAYRKDQQKSNSVLYSTFHAMVLPQLSLSLSLAWV